MPHVQRIVHLSILVFGSLALCSGFIRAEEPSPTGGTGSTPEEIEFFEKRIRPALAEHCAECHSANADEIGGDLLLDSREAMLKGGESGPAIVPGKPAESLLISALEYRDYEMPPEGKLPEDVIADFRKWIRMGAPDPRAASENEPGNGPGKSSDRDETPRRLWSLEPIAAARPPAVTHKQWPRSDIDRFILARLEAKRLEPVGDAERVTLLRRLYFDLIGLPPTSADVESFLTDDQDGAVARVVDRLLESPRFGERWGRHWLDVARYAESTGNSRDVLIPNAWRYRDYVIDALNRDLPYDRFVAEQLAGDLLPAEDAAERRRLQIATGLLALGSKSLNGGNLELDIVDDQIDVVGKAFLGLTVSCARCHDHKFDPIPTADYYALAGIFRSTETKYGGGTNRPKKVSDFVNVYLVLGDEDAAEEAVEREQTLARLQKRRGSLAKQLATMEKKLPKDWQTRRDALMEAREEGTADEAPESLPPEDAKFLEQVEKLESTRERLRGMQREIKELEKQPAPDLTYAVGVREAKQVTDSPIQIRGEKNKRGDVVPRGFLSCVALETCPEVPDDRSGRLALAHWITAPENPLTARVMVNRVWQHLFGRGLVETPNNFGSMGQQPSHPMLLDFLAHRFMHEHAWSVKSLIRELVLSRTYQLSADADTGNLAVDPGNTLYWRMSRRRLEAESIRDAILAVSGALQLDPPQRSPVAEVGEGEVGRGINTRPLEKPFMHRSVYLPIVRGILPEFLRIFDFPEPSNPQGARDVTSVPAQSLYLMNSPLVLEQAERLAKRVEAARQDPAERVQLAYRLCFTRHAKSEEIAAAVQFVERLAETDSNVEPWTLFCQSLLASAEFRFVD